MLNGNLDKKLYIFVRFNAPGPYFVACLSAWEWL